MPTWKPPPMLMSENQLEWCLAQKTREELDQMARQLGFSGVATYERLPD